MKRMYGDFEMTSRYSPPPQGGKRKRHLQGTDDHFTILPELMDLYGVPGSPDGPQAFASGGGDSYFGRLRDKRQSQSRGNGGGSTSNGGSNGNGSGSRTNGRQSSSESSAESTGR